jgi:hypothetical protein
MREAREEGGGCGSVRGVCCELGQPGQDKRQDRIGPKGQRERTGSAVYEGDGKSRLGGNIVSVPVLRSGWFRLLPLPLGLGLGWVGLDWIFGVWLWVSESGRESRGHRIVRGDGKRRRASEKLDRCRTASLRARCRCSYSLLQQLQLRYGWADCRAVHEAAASGPRECAVPSQDRDSRLPVNLMGGRTFG